MFRNASSAIALFALLSVPATLSAQYQVEDATGKLVGEVGSVEANGSATVIHEISDGRKVVLVVTPGFFSSFGTGLVYYQSNDCSGTPYIEASLGFFTASTVQSGTLFVPQEGAVPQNVFAQSIDFGNGFCEPQPFQQYLVAASEVGDLNAEFTTPLSLVAKPVAGAKDVKDKTK